MKLKMFDSTLFFFLSTPAYFLGMLLYIYAALFQNRGSGDAGSGEAALGVTARMPAPQTLDKSMMGTWALRVGVLFSTIGVILRTIELGTASDWAVSTFLPVTSTYETLTFMAWLIPLVYLLMERRYRISGVGAIMAGTAFTMLAVAAAPSIAPRDISPVVPSLQSHWLVIHVLFVIIGISLFTVGFGASLVLLVRRAMGTQAEALKKLEELSYKANALGFPFYGIGGIVFGGIWAKEAWGNYWEWDPKETAMLIAWLSYAIYLHVRLQWGWRDIKVAFASVAAYMVVLFTWIGINYFVASLHSFT